MSILVYTESEGNKYKKQALEAVSYAKELANISGEKLYTLSVNVENTEALNDYGPDHNILVNDEKLTNFKAKTYSNLISDVANEIKASFIILTNSSNSRYIAPIISIKLDSCYFSNVVELPKSLSPLSLKSSCYTNKAFVINSSESKINVISLSSNCFGLHENKSNPEIEEKSYDIVEESLVVKKLEKTKGNANIADADIVVSGGRGLKGPENWNLIEDLADVLGAATACSKPVSDMGWRPHSEHVGQTGKPVASNLYIAIGVSGAVQHIAGINSSKIKVVINNDPEAPFFKAADYGIVGDAFEVVPKLTEKLKNFLNQ
ncbi:MAG: electron transfer flavoprotein subunit alpha [Flavobacteriaceae bacterium]|nr:electron transfer flavoprotein subunit alpha [Flavobacteriaceae bacterium]|tara:strand:+ start:708 stop:1664 length:957 start_codon:yes stop_codon:yes gene_type:complete